MATFDGVYKAKDIERWFATNSNFVGVLPSKANPAYLPKSDTISSAWAIQIRAMLIHKHLQNVQWCLEGQRCMTSVRIAVKGDTSLNPCLDMKLNRWPWPSPHLSAYLPSQDLNKDKRGKGIYMYYSVLFRRQRYIFFKKNTIFLHYCVVFIPLSSL